ncbi:MAG: putative toxin-antitoxin system toxin component, PIN family [Kiritimatiellia bacterium]
MIFAVIDTNVIVSSLLTKHPDSATAVVVAAAMNGAIVPLYNSAILAEYREVLTRPRFGFSARLIAEIVAAIELNGLDLEAEPWPDGLPDETDRVFFEVALAGQSDAAKLVTGNLKHYPRVNFVVTPAQMASLLA